MKFNNEQRKDRNLLRKLWTRRRFNKGKKLNTKNLNYTQGQKRKEDKTKSGNISAKNRIWKRSIGGVRYDVRSGIKHDRPKRNLIHNKYGIDNTSKRNWIKKK